MFDYRISKHPHLNEACRTFALRHKMAKLAERAGMNVQTLRNKLNPEQPHQLTAPDLWLLELMARLVASSDCSDDDKEAAISWLSELTSELVTRMNDYGVGQDESMH